MVEGARPSNHPQVKMHFDSFLPGWDGNQLGRAAEYVVERVHHHLRGRTVGSRVSANARTIASNLSVLSDHSVLRQRFDAHRSTIESFWIVRALDRGLIPVDYRLRRAISGFPGRYAEANTSPWDFQQELLWHSALALGGVAGLRAEEPDLTIEAGNERLALALKRVSSAKDARIDERSREAARQIARSGHPGLIVLQIDPPEVQLTPEGHRNSFLDNIAERAVTLAARHEPHARVYGAIVYAVVGKRTVDKQGGETIGIQFDTAQRWVEPDPANFKRLAEFLANIGGRVASALALEVASLR